MNVEGTICVKRQTSKYGLDIVFKALQECSSCHCLIFDSKTFKKQEHQGIESQSLRGIRFFPNHLVSD